MWYDRFGKIPHPFQKIFKHFCRLMASDRDAFSRFFGLEKSLRQKMIAYKEYLRLQTSAKIEI